MRKLLRWSGLTAATLLALILLLGTAFYVVGSSKINRTYVVQTALLTIPEGDAAAIERGAHLSRIFGCTDCHGSDLSGQVFIDEPPFRITASNLTAGEGGIGQSYSAEDYDRAIRHGVRPTGRGLVVMPSSTLNEMSDEDAAALIAYLRQIPPVDNVLPPTEIRVVGRLLAAGLIDPAHEIRTQPARAGATPTPGPTATYGEYLANIVCAHCHGGDLRGNDRPPAPESPPAPDLAAAGAWPLDSFIETMRTGITPAGRQMSADYMPWPVTAEMHDYEIEALHAFLGTLAN